MPYEIKDSGKPGPKRYVILRADTGKVVGHSASRGMAEASIRARYMHEHGKAAVPAMSATDSTTGGAFAQGFRGGRPSPGTAVKLARSRLLTKLGVKLGASRQQSSPFQGKSLGGTDLSLEEVIAILEARGGVTLDLEVKDLASQRAYAADTVATAPEAMVFDDSLMACTYIFAASHNRDRIGDFTEVMGLYTVNHEKLPSVYLDHGKTAVKYPIGRDKTPDDDYTVQILGDEGLAICTSFLSQSLPEAVQCYHLYKEKILTGGSFGYRPMRAKRLPPDPERLLPAGLHLIQTDLCETTMTAQPLNPDCARKCLFDTIEGKPLAPALRAIIEPYADPGKTWSNGADLRQEIQMTAATQGVQGKALPAASQGNGDPNAGASVSARSGDNGAAAGAAAAPNGEEGKLRHGVQFLGDIHEALTAICQYMDDEDERIDNDAVKKGVEKIRPKLDQLKSLVALIHNKAYPDSDKLEEGAPGGNGDGNGDNGEPGEKSILGRLTHKTITALEARVATLEKSLAGQNGAGPGVGQNGAAGETMGPEEAALILNQIGAIAKRLDTQVARQDAQDVKLKGTYGL